MHVNPCMIIFHAEIRQTFGMVIMAVAYNCSFHVIQPYTHGNIFNHKADRKRTLLAHRQEIKKFQRKVNEKGLTIVPLEIYLKGNLVKMKIALARGKNVHDKKEAIKERDAKIDARREIRELNKY